MSAACRRSRRATTSRCGSRSARLSIVGERFAGMRACLRLRQPRRVRDRRPRGPAVSRAARCARAGAVRGHRRRSGGWACSPTSACPRPTSRRALRGCDALVLECNHDLDMLAGERLSALAEAPHQRALRPPAQRRRRGAARGARQRAGCSTSSPRICRSRTTRRTARAPRSPARSAAPTTGSASPTRPTVSPGANSLNRDMTGDGDGKAGRSYTRARRRRSMRPTIRTCSSCTTATTCRRSTASSSRSST